MTTGTKSLLFGVHAFWWHPIVVAWGWKDCYGRWPCGLAEWLAIILHDVGYLGSPKMDDAYGQDHPRRSVFFFYKWFSSWMSPRESKRTYDLIIGHSRYYSAKQIGIKTSELYVPDKVAVLYDPPWFYLLRAHLSGEIREYVENAPAEAQQSPEHWIYWYREKVRKEFDSE